MRTSLLVATLAAMASASSDGKRTVRWGIMGTGTIENDFVRVSRLIGQPHRKRCRERARGARLAGCRSSHAQP